MRNIVVAEEAREIQQFMPVCPWNPHLHGSRVDLVEPLRRSRLSLRRIRGPPIFLDLCKIGEHFLALERGPASLCGVPHFALEILFYAGNPLALLA
jgi:hypothetical protein